MKSMVKRDVNIAITPHIELITQMILDAVEVVEFRRGKSKTDFLRRDDAIYHRFLRQTGHSTALKHILSKQFLEETGLEVIAMFAKEETIKHTLNREEVGMNNAFTTFQFEKGDVLIGRNPKVLIVSDSLHDPAYQSKVWSIIQNNPGLQTSLTLVVFLG